MSFNVIREFAPNGILIKVRCNRCHAEIREILTQTTLEVAHMTEMNIMSEHEQSCQLKKWRKTK